VSLFTGNFAELAQSNSDNHSLTYLLTYLLAESFRASVRFCTQSPFCSASASTTRDSLPDYAKKPFFSFLPSTKRDGNIFGCICLYVCLSVYIVCLLCLCNMITFESLDVESLLLVCEFIFRRYESISYKVIKSRSRSQQRKREIPYSRSVFNWQ